VFNILKQTSTLEDSCFYSSLPAEAVMHIAILNCEPFHAVYAASVGPVFPGHGVYTISVVMIYACRQATLTSGPRVSL